MMLASMRARVRPIAFDGKFSGARASALRIIVLKQRDLQSDAEANSRACDVAVQRCTNRHACATSRRTRARKYDVVACRSHVLVDIMLSTELTGTD